MKTKILIVEDDYLVAYDIKLILDKNDFDVQLCDTYDSCIKNLNTFKPEFILLDINLGKGFEGIRIGSYLNLKSEIPFIYITAYTDVETLKKIQTTKPAGYLSKPYREIDIINNISLALYNKKTGIGNEAPSVLEENKYSKPIRLALEYIETNINQEIKTDELIRVSGWSKFHFIREFAKEVKKTPYQYVFDKKMQLASSKLRNTYHTIKEIAFDLGYTSNSSFTNAFIKYSGESPSMYRRKYYK